jgi:hypothetical protein
MKLVTSAGARRALCGGSLVVFAAVLVILVGSVESASAAPTHPYLPALTQSGFTEPCGDAVDSHGDLYVADYEADVIKVFGPAGEALTEFTPAEPICGLAVDSTGAIYAAGFGAKLTKYVPAGGAFPPTTSTAFAVDSSAGTGGVLTEAGVTSVAVDPSNDHVYAVEGQSKVGVYDSSGALLETLAEGLVAGAEYAGVDVYGVNGDIYISDRALGHEVVYVLNPAGTQILTEIDGSDSPGGRFEGLGYANLAVDQSDGNVLVGDLGAHNVVDEFDPAGTFVSRIGPEAGGETITDAGPTDVAVDNGASSPNEGDVYVTSYTGKVYAFGPLSYGPPAAEPPLANTEGATEITSTSALLHATVNPKGAATISCEFEWGPAAGTYTAGTAPCSPDPGSSATVVAVSAEAQGLSAGATYHYQVVIETAGGVTEGGDRVLTREIPSVGVPSATSGATTSGADALLQGTVNPNFSTTTYVFEYVTDQEFAEGQFTEATKVPATPSSIGGGGTFVPVSQAVSGLQASTTYHLRLVAENQVEPATGPERTFTTPPLGSELPDGRGFELVSPADKRPDGYVGTVQSSNLRIQAASNGESVYYIINNGLADSTAGGEISYIAKRSSIGWQSTQVTPPDLVPSLNAHSESGNVIYADPTNLSCTLVSTAQPLTADTAPVIAEHGGKSLYRRNADGSYTLISNQVPSNPGATDPSYFTDYPEAEASGDCSHVFFQTKYKLLPQAPAGVQKGLYEWDNGTLRYAGVLPDGSVAPDAHPGGGPGLAAPSLLNVISPDGGRFFFSANSNSGNDAGHTAVFVREGTARTVDASKSQTSGSGGNAFFQMASADGNHVFFLARYGLAGVSSTGAQTCEKTGKGCDLYDYEVDSGTLSDLSADPNPADSAGASVNGVLDASQDGSYVYFAARGQLVPGHGNSEGQNLASGQFNVFLAHAAHLSYVGKLDQLDIGGFDGPGGLDSPIVNFPEHWSSRVTPDGKHLLFASGADVTGYADAAGLEAYLYSAESETTTCVSCPTGGESSDNPEPLPTAQIKGISEYPRTLSADGSRVFFESPDALVPGATAGGKNIYEWENGSIYLLLADPPGAPFESRFEDASSSGNDIFISTKQNLAPQDFDNESDLYDLRVGGGFPYTQPAPECDVATSGCQGAGAAAPGAPNTSSQSFRGPGNPPNKTKRHHKKHHKKKHHRTQKKKHHKDHGKRAGNGNGRAGR